MTVLMQVAQAITHVHMLLCVEKVVPCHLNREAVVEEGLGKAHIGLNCSPGERHVLLVALAHYIQTCRGGERGQYLDVVVELDNEEWILGAQEACWRGYLNPVFHHSQGELGMINAKLWREIDHHSQCVGVVSVLAGKQRCGLAARHFSRHIHNNIAGALVIDHQVHPFPHCHNAQLVVD